jgi:Domain of unknown function (DUF4070)
MAASVCRVLMVYPAFFGETFWNYSEVCKLVGARYTAAPLGLITVAAMLPQSWNVRLINRNTEDLSEADVAWADVVMTGGMLLQQADTLEIVTLAHKHAKHAVVGGPDVTSSPPSCCNFETARPLRDILLDYKSILERIFDPAAYAKRLDRLVSLVDCSGRPRELPEGDLRSKFNSLDRIHRILSDLPTREPFRKVLTNCINANPAVISYIVMLMAVSPSNAGSPRPMPSAWCGW